MPECSSFPARSSELGVVYNRGWESSLKETALFPWTDRRRVVLPSRSLFSGRRWPRIPDTTRRWRRINRVPTPGAAVRMRTLQLDMARDGRRKSVPQTLGRRRCVTFTLSDLFLGSFEDGSLAPLLLAFFEELSPSVPYLQAVLFFCNLPSSCIRLLRIPWSERINTIIRSSTIFNCRYESCRVIEINTQDLRTIPRSKKAARNKTWQSNFVSL